MNTNQSAIETAQKAATATRTDKTSKMVAFNDARIALDSALGAVKSDGTPTARKVLTAAEQSARYTELELQGATERHDAATAALARLERESKLSQHAARASSVGFESFSSAATKVARKIAEARARLADAEAEAEAIVRGFQAESKGVAAQAVALGAPAPVALDYSKTLAGLVAKAEGKPASVVLADVWKASAPAGMSADAALAALQNGVDARRVASLVATIKDATARAAAGATLVVCGHVESSRGDPSLRAVSRFRSAHGEAQGARKALADLGLKAASDAVPVDRLSERLAHVGADRVHAKVVELRASLQATLPGYPSADEVAKHRAKLADKFASELSSMGFEEIAAKFTTAHSPDSRRIAPREDNGAFLEVGAQGL